MPSWWESNTDQTSTSLTIITWIWVKASNQLKKICLEVSCLKMHCGHIFIFNTLSSIKLMHKKQFTFKFSNIQVYFSGRFTFKWSSVKTYQNRCLLKQKFSFYSICTDVMAIWLGSCICTATPYWRKLLKSANWRTVEHPFGRCLFPVLLIKP